MREPGARLPYGALRLLSLALGLALSVVGSTGAAVAHFSDEDAASLPLATATLDAPTAPGTSPGTCTSSVGDAIVVTWTGSTSAAAAGYEILRSTVSGGPYSVVGTVGGSPTESYADSSLAFSTTYHYVIRTVRESWRSDGTAEVSRTTRSSTCA